MKDFLNRKFSTDLNFLFRKFLRIFISYLGNFQRFLAISQAIRGSFFSHEANFFKILQGFQISRRIQSEISQSARFCKKLQNFLFRKYFRGQISKIGNFQPYNLHEISFLGNNFLIRKLLLTDHVTLMSQICLKFEPFLDINKKMKL